MSPLPPHASGDAFASLRRLVPARPTAERCELCGSAVGSDHPHLMEPARRRLVCACPACSALFSGGAEQRYVRVPRRITALPRFQMSDVQWESLRLPIALAFFYSSGPRGAVVALYPSPAGATESLLALDTWTDIVRANPILGGMAADVEALLVNRVGRERNGGVSQYFIVPIDECFRLVGIIRLHWRGLSGGPAVWGQIARFFADLSARASVPREVSGA
jgi:hypothetical protein